MTTLIRISREDAILYLAYLAAAFSYLAYRESERASGRAVGTQAHIDHLDQRIGDLEETVDENAENWTALDELEERDVQEDVDGEDETESVDVDEDWSEDEDDQEETVVE